MTVALWLGIALAFATGLALVVTPLMVTIARRLRLYDAPDGVRRQHAAPVPRLGGVGVYLAAAFVGAVIILGGAQFFVASGAEGDRQISILAGVFLGSAILFIIGLIDDVRGLSPAIKFLGQVAAASIAWYFGTRLGTIALGYGQGVSTGMLEIPLLLLWIVGVTNAYNFIDGLNGLAGGIGIVASVTIFVVAAALGHFWVMVPALVLGGALLGFLPFNFPKARIFLGDAGSLSIGFLLAVLSLHASVNEAGAVLVVVPILAVFVPLLDGALAIIRRWLRHVPLSGADARHIHHRLLALGLSSERTTVLLWTLAAGMSAFGLLIALTAPFVAASIAILGLVGLSVLVIYGTNLLSYDELIIAGEVLLTAPSRARRVISDEINALDVTVRIQKAKSISELSKILSEAASSFGFLGMQLGGEDIAPGADDVLSAEWGWKLDYPIRISGDARKVSYVLSIWCSPKHSARPYGAERVARVVGPAVQKWFETDAREMTPPHKQPAITVPATQRRRLRIS